ncbi:hypothetical protein BJV82DRAFT_698848, partial [Fennellomyces sp. T-0311]
YERVPIGQKKERRNFTRYKSLGTVTVCLFIVVTMSIYIYIAFFIFAAVLYANRPPRTASPRLTDSSPFSSPSSSPTLSPSSSPTLSPSSSPTLSPSSSPEVTPPHSPQLTPLHSPQLTPLHSPQLTPLHSPQFTPSPSPPPPSAVSHIVFPRIRIGNCTLEWDSELDEWEEEQERVLDVWFRRAPEWRAQAKAGNWRRFVLARNATQRLFGPRPSHPTAAVYGVPTVKHGTTRHRGYPFLQLDLWAFCLAERTIHHRYSGVRQCNVAAMLGARSYGDQRRSGVNAAEKGPRWRVSVRMVGAGGGRMASGGVVWLPKPGRAGPLNMPVVLSSARCQRSAAHIHLGRHKRKEHPVHTLENITGLFIHFGDTHSSITITVLMWENVKIPSSIHSGKTKAAKRFYGIKNHFIHRWHTNSSNVRMASSGTASIHPLSKKQVSHAPYGASTCMSIKATLDSATVTLTIHGASIKGTLPHPR